MANPSISLEWFFDVLNKRLAPPYNLKLEDLFLCVPWNEEAEFKFEITSVFKKDKHGITAQGNNAEHDYPYVAKLIKNSNKKLTIRVFLVKHDRLRAALILWHKKYPYPKINKVKKMNIKSHHLIN